MQGHIWMMMFGIDLTSCGQFYLEQVEIFFFSSLHIIATKPFHKKASEAHFMQYITHFIMSLHPLRTTCVTKFQKFKIH